MALPFRTPTIPDEDQEFAHSVPPLDPPHLPADATAPEINAFLRTLHDREVCSTDYQSPYVHPRLISFPHGLDRAQWARVCPPRSRPYLISVTGKPDAVHCYTEIKAPSQVETGHCQLMLYLLMAWEVGSRQHTGVFQCMGSAVMVLIVSL